MNEIVFPILASAIADNFDTIPKDIRNTLLGELADYEGHLSYVPQSIVEKLLVYFEKLPEDMTTILF
jgi:hypothetical protein